MAKAQSKNREKRGGRGNPPPKGRGQHVVVTWPGRGKRGEGAKQVEERRKKKRKCPFVLLAQRAEMAGKKGEGGLDFTS